MADGLGFEKQSKYVNEYFFRANMRASIYMSVVVIVLVIVIMILIMKMKLKYFIFYQIKFKIFLNLINS